MPHRPMIHPASARISSRFANNGIFAMISSS
jgi:hypothetical protein